MMGDGVTGLLGQVARMHPKTRIQSHLDAKEGHRKRI